MKDINFFRVKNSLFFREIKNKNEALEDLNCDGFLIGANEKIARGIIASLKDKKFKGKIGLVGGDDAFNRRAIESLRIGYLVSPERGAKFDNLKQRDSGLNHVVCKMAFEKGIKIVVDMGEISGLKGKEKAIRIAKVMQNVKVARKVGCRVLIASFARDKGSVFDELGRKSFGVSLGMSSSEVRDCIGF